MPAPLLMSACDVLDRINPVDPDQLARRAGGGWTAKWLNPVGVQIELLSTLPDVVLLGEEYTIGSGSTAMHAIDFAFKGG
jgi:hypothetical protein